MSWVEVPCERSDCPNTFKVDVGQDSARCPACGRQHEPPWDSEGSAPPVSDDPTPRADGGGELAIDADGSAVHIHVHIHR